MSVDPRDWACYVITDARLSRGRSYEEIVRAAVAGGADAIQFREKHATSAELKSTAATLRAICQEAGRAFVVNDRIDLAVAVVADALHVGQDDLPAVDARHRLAPAMRLGVSATSLEEALRAVDDGADHLGVGPIFDARTTKSDAAEPMGLDGLRRVREAVDLPLIAIGGIDHGNAADVIAAGADGCAVISCVVGADDVTDATRRLRDTILEARARRGS